MSDTFTSVLEQQQNNPGEAFLPQIQASKSTLAQGAGANQSEFKRDFFNLFKNPVVHANQTDAVIKQLYGQILEKKFTSRKKSAQEGVYRPPDFDSAATRQQFGIIYGTNHDDFIAKQKIVSPEERLRKDESVKKLRSDQQVGFVQATSLQEESQHQAKTLFGRILNNSEHKYKLHQVPGSPRKYRDRFGRSPRRRQSAYIKNGRTISSQALIEESEKKSFLYKQSANTSGIYVPAERLNRMKEASQSPASLAKQRNAKALQIKLALAGLEQDQGPESPGKRKQKKDDDIEKKKRVLKRRVSFSEGLREYDDAKGLKNPLREQRGPSITHARTIMNMMKSTRFPIPEIMINMPDNWDFFMDSLTANGYDSDEINNWVAYQQECAAPENSMESLEEIDFASSSDEDAIEEPVQEEKKEEKKEVKKKPEKVRKETLFLHGFEQNQLGAFP